MDDILSGQKIDQSVSGPIPPNRDDRDRNILLEQKEKQNQDAIGGSQFPPKPQPLPPIPEAPEVAPPLPVIPSFNLGISGSALEETREIARQTVVDVLKNVTINGNGPSVEGSSISFNIPQQTPASEAFVFQGIMVSQPLPTSSILPLPTISRQPEPQTVPEIQSIDIPIPTRSTAPTVQLTDSTSTETTVAQPYIPPPSPLIIQTAPEAPPPTTPTETTSTTVVQPETEPVEPPRAGQEPSETGNAIIDRIVSKIPKNEPINGESIRSAANEEGLQTTQRSWSNYIDPQTIKDAIEEKRKEETEANQKIKEALEITKGMDVERVKDYYAGNTPFPPLVEFHVCLNGERKTFLIPAFGPYPYG